MMIRDSGLLFGHPVYAIAIGIIAQP